MQPSQTIETFSTPAANPPAAFNRLRRALHDAAGADHLAEHRTAEAVRELRHRAKHFQEAMQVYAGTGLGYWYAELAARFMRQASEIEADAKAKGVLS